MSTQTINVTLGGDDFAVVFTASCTDDTFTELKDETNTKSLNDILRGRTIRWISGNYAAGAAIVRIKDIGGLVRDVMPLNLVANERIYALDSPVTVGESSIVTALCVAVPT